MVVRAPPNDKKEPMRPSPVLNITKISSLKRYPDRDYALDLLHQMAQAVAPLVHEYNFKVGLLCEMYPKSPALLGLNVNKGQKILIRLRTPYNDRLFYPMCDLIGTLLHELTHNIHGPHDAKFYRFLDELRAKFEGGNFGSSGYVCESNKLGSRPALFGHQKSVRDKRLAAVTKTKYKSESRRLGGKNCENISIRQATLEAARRRLNDSKWCPVDNMDKAQHGNVSEIGTKGASETISQYREIIDLTREGNEEDDDDLEIIEIDACDRSLLSQEVDTSKLWAKALKPSLEDDDTLFMATVDRESSREIQVQYVVSSSPGRTFIGAEHLYPRRKLVADLDFDQIIERGSTIQVTHAVNISASQTSLGKRDKKLPHPEEQAEVKRTSVARMRETDSERSQSFATRKISENKRGKKPTTNKSAAKLADASSQTIKHRRAKPRSGSKDSHKNESGENKNNKKKVRSISFEELLR